MRGGARPAAHIPIGNLTTLHWVVIFKILDFAS